jgi:dipeptidyl aminopeptidase/acylaminoacyl peptidase
MTKDFILKTTKNNSLYISSCGYESIGKVPCLIFVHGFKGFKDWGFGPYLANYFAEHGYFVLTFNFSHNGTGNSSEFTELDKFAENTFSLEISELSELIENYKAGFFGEISNKKIGVLGHSRGGAISILTSSIRTDVNAVAVWSSVAKLDRYSERQKEKWRKTGVFEVQNQRTKQVMRLNVSLLDDIEKNKYDLLNIENSVRYLNKPLFIAHGEQDLAVPISEAEMLYSWSDKTNTEFYKIAATGHTFDMVHPFQGSNEKFEKLLSVTLEFFNNNLN